MESDAFTLAESIGLALRPAELASININLMPPELVEQARTIRRIPFLIVGAVAFLVALGAAWFAETHATDVAKAQLDCVMARNDKLESLSKKLKAGQDAVVEESEGCESFQRLLWERSAALLRLRAVGESLIPGMWITAWTPLAASRERDGKAAPQGARITIRGWKDVMSKAEKDWAAKNGGKKSTAATIVESSLKKQMFNPDEVKIISQKDVKEFLVEFTIQCAS